MANAKLLKQLIKAGADGDIDALHKVCEDIIFEERRKNHHRLADELENVLYSRSRAFHNEVRRRSDEVPFDNERGLPLLAFKEPSRGKTLTAEVLATELARPLIDSAIWRRFEEVVLFEPPTWEQLQEFLKMRLRGVRYEFAVDNRKILSWFEGMSYADVERTLIRAIKEMVLHKSKFLDLHYVENAVKREDTLHGLRHKDRFYPLPDSSTLAHILNHLPGV